MCIMIITIVIIIRRNRVCVCICVRVPERGTTGFLCGLGGGGGERH